jgi:hypothetical protein
MLRVLLASTLLTGAAQAQSFTAPPLLHPPATITAPALTLNPMTLLQVMVLALTGRLGGTSSSIQGAGTAMPNLPFSSLPTTGSSAIPAYASTGGIASPSSYTPVSQVATANNDLIGIPPTPPVDDGIAGEPPSPLYPPGTLYPANVPLPSSSGLSFSNAGDTSMDAMPMNDFSAPNVLTGQ